MARQTAAQREAARLMREAHLEKLRKAVFQIEAELAAAKTALASAEAEHARLSAPPPPPAPPVVSDYDLRAHQGEVAGHFPKQFLWDDLKKLRVPVSIVGALRRMQARRPGNGDVHPYCPATYLAADEPAPLIAVAAGAAGDALGKPHLEFWAEATGLHPGAAACCVAGCRPAAGRERVGGAHIWVQGLPFGRVAAIAPLCAAHAGGGPCAFPAALRLRRDAVLALTSAAEPYATFKAGTHCLGTRSAAARARARARA
ncbi:MAG: hypothetical protein J3K34DRAFT_520972 [Monoraphidium minutum]|nr:MAG: hypothetical protein J3K34DRAFT_520972 [Monoraphidium minutum]